jgi:hypothetical protein
MNLTYTDHDGLTQQVKGCKLTVDKLGRHWIWSEQLSMNLAYNTQGLENTLISAIDSLLYIIHLRDAKIASLKRIADLAEAFADEIKPDQENEL